MNEPREANQQAILWHSRVARRFDARYATDRVFQERLAIWEDAIRRYGNPRHRALDLGCGPGHLLACLAEHNAVAVGLDGSEEMLGICREQVQGRGQGAVELVQADIARLADLGLGSFDLVIASSVLEYIADLDGVLDSIAGILRPTGHLLFSIPNRASLFRRVQPLLYRLFGRPAYVPYIRNKATANEIRDRLHAHGFTVIATRLFAPTAFLSRLMRPVGLDAWSENLILVECARARPPAGSS